MAYRSDQGDEVTLAVLHSFVPNQSDAWQYTLDYLTEYYERALTHQREVVALRLPSKSLLALSVNDAPQFRCGNRWRLSGAGETIWPSERQSFILPSLRRRGIRTSRRNPSLGRTDALPTNRCDPPPIGVCGLLEGS